ncbi:DUF1272 domain-containing protein [Aquitalea magnusonii]|uniref:Urease n=1 Tax=Aquitalea magnusonii TaxID=332411 RepID=A0A318J8Y2_9NEIS|nr:DUF1272 domain-containing protein [Aquitalea magnusonii]PXX44383.1 hypothetical protein DFR38_11365 [Aquitalea magnusonii]
MLELRPNCEHCRTPLPPESSDARICSFECTFCADCVALLQQVCPNCGGGFSPRPLRPASHGRHDNDLQHYPASQHEVYRPVDLAEHARWLAERQRD